MPYDAIGDDLECQDALKPSCSLLLTRRANTSWQTSSLIAEWRCRRQSQLAINDSLGLCFCSTETLLVLNLNQSSHGIDDE